MGSVEISITTWAEEADKATKLEYSASDRSTVENLLPMISRLALIQGSRNIWVENIFL